MCNYWKKFQSESLEFDVSRLVLRSFSRLILLVKTGMRTREELKDQGTQRLL